MSLVFIATGHTHLGMTSVGKDGNITKQTPARFEYAPGGPCVAVGKMDPDTMEPRDDTVSVFGDWDAAGYLAAVLELLEPGRQVNIPDFKAIIKAAYEQDGDDLVCDYCQIHNCPDCIVREWKDET